MFNADAIENVNGNPGLVPIVGYYCTCKSGARTLGTCAHIASVLSYLGYAKHEINIKYPSVDLLNNVSDAGNRLLQVHPNGPRVIES